MEIDNRIISDNFYIKLFVLALEQVNIDFLLKNNIANYSGKNFQILLSFNQKDTKFAFELANKITLKTKNSRKSIIENLKVSNKKFYLIILKYQRFKKKFEKILALVHVGRLPEAIYKAEYLLELQSKGDSNIMFFKNTVKK